MEFTIPQFIEKEAKIVGPLTFKQFIFIGIAGGFCLFLYFATPFPVFVFGVIFFLGGAMALAFVKINKTPLPVFIKNVVFFLFKPRVYLWKKERTPLHLYSVKKIEKVEEKKEEQIFKTINQSRLNRLLTRLETKGK